MWGSIISSTIGAAAGLAQQYQQNEFNADEAQKNRDFQSTEAALTRDFNASEAKKARDFNSQESELARQYNTAEREAAQAWNLEQWNRENEYNSPAAQMERFMAAGINPNAAMSMMSGGQSGNIVTSGQSSGAASGPAASAGSPSGSQASSVGMSDSVNSLLGNAYNNALQAAYMEKQIAWYDRRQQAEIEKIWQDVRLTSLNADEQDLVVRNFQRMSDAQYESLVAVRNETMARIDAIKRTQDREDKLAASTIELNSALVDKTLEDTEKIKSEKVGQDIDNVIQSAYMDLVKKNPNITLDSFKAMVSMSDEDWQICSDRFVKQQGEVIKEQGKQARRTKWNDMAADVVGSTVQGLIDAGLIYATKGQYAVAKIGKNGKPMRLTREQEAVVNEYNSRLKAGEMKPFDQY